MESTVEHPVAICWSCRQHKDPVCNTCNRCNDCNDGNDCNKGRDCLPLER